MDLLIPFVCCILFASNAAIFLLDSSKLLLELFRSLLEAPSATEIVIIAVKFVKGSKSCLWSFINLSCV